MTRLNGFFAFGIPTLFQLVLKTPTPARFFFLVFFPSSFTVVRVAVGVGRWKFSALGGFSIANCFGARSFRLLV